MENNININKKNRYLWIVIVFAILLVGGTLASIIYNIIVSNGRYNTVTTCLEVDYDIDESTPITGTLFPSRNAIGGLNGKVGLKINDSCSLEGIGTLSLNVVDASSTLIQTVDAHCENSKTLETLTSYGNESVCTSNGENIWVTDGSALKYAVYNTSEVTDDIQPISVGYVNKNGSIDIYNNFPVTKTNVNYYIYVWLDGNLSDNSYANLLFNGNVSASVVQKPEEEVGPSFDDHTLMITSYTCDDENGNPVTVGDNPYFTYTGQCEVIDDGDGDWRVKFLTSGDFTSELNIPIDVFLVGGGGGGYNGDLGGGGGGGYTTTSFANIKAQTPYSIYIGDGGDPGNDGESTTGFGSIAKGGSSGKLFVGGTGGSGGGAGRNTLVGTGGNGGSDGGNGGDTNPNAGGSGQEVTTREFGETDGTLYSTGGNGIGSDPIAGVSNTGDGGGGLKSGGSGIIVIRNTRISTQDVSKLPSVAFDFTYADGYYAIVSEGNGNWKIKFLTSGTFTSYSNKFVDVFLVGGGGGGYDNAYAGGGGGGYTTISFANIKTNEPYEINIGNGGLRGNDGESTTGFGSIAKGGSSGKYFVGGTGGSGGGAYYKEGGTNGGRGTNNSSSSGGVGQEVITREFGEIDGTLYSGGGGGSGDNGSILDAKGGSGGGGSGQVNGVENLGGGGGGLASGGSGIVIIRNTRISTQDVSELPSVAFDFEYQNGYYAVLNDGGGNWRIKFLSSGTFISGTNFQGEVFLVGGGGGGYNNGYGGGGGGGYTRTVDKSIVANTQYDIIVGLGGSVGEDGAETTGFGFVANGGISGNYLVGGNGGSGGGGFTKIGGSNGLNGEFYDSTYVGGYGQIDNSGPNGETGNTREFGEDTGTLYSGGGGGMGSNASFSDGLGGSGGGGSGQTNGVENLGGGGGGLASGGSGIVIIRNKR